MTKNFVKLDAVEALPATDPEQFFTNVKANMSFRAPFCHIFKNWAVPKPNPIALIGGGPSLKDQIEHIKSFPGPTVVCGSAHDYVISQGVRPTYAIVCDPDPLVIKYLQRVDFDTTYLIATCCDPGVFSYLHKQNAAIMKWHCFNDDHERFKAIDPTFAAIGGGCTVGLRALTWSMMMGYKYIHFFGFDSCQGPGDEHHAYQYCADEPDEKKFYDVKFDPDNPTVYRCAGYQLGQAFNFRDFYTKYYDYFIPHVHGGGLMADVARRIDYDIRLEKLSKLRTTRKPDADNRLEQSRE
jgi:hypothetical protein